ncbi:MAG: hypothetical protein IPM26_07695 [Saprospiraceae bacterium]|nr:hypothetical protein [Saprospiraceae bacterium]
MPQSHDIYLLISYPQKVSQKKSNQVVTLVWMITFYTEWTDQNFVKMGQMAVIYFSGA